MKITLLGTGTPAPSLKRQSSGYLIQVGNDLIVMDQRQRRRVRGILSFPKREDAIL
jgi:ribonuclease BN (tRNA processing enzyme)